MNTTIRKEFVDTFNKLTHKLSPWEVWKDFVVMCSCSFSNALDKSHYDEREKLYMDTIKKYDKEDQAAFPKLLAYTVMALEENPDQDFLGTIYTELGLVNKQHKQIFTPYNVSRLMAEITMENVAQEVKEKGYITLNDDCCGAGSTLIAGVNTIKSILEKQRLNFQNHLLVAAQDIDNEQDLEIQEKFLAKINELIDCGVLAFNTEAAEIGGGKLIDFVQIQNKVIELVA